MKPFQYILWIVILTCWYACEQTTRKMDGFAVHGIDVSHYQQKINWDTLGAQNVKFAFVKTSEGETYADSLFCNNWTEMKRVGLIRGAYHFFRPTLSAELQAENFLFNLDLEYGDLPPVLDVEVTDGVSNGLLIQKIDIWMDLVQIKTGATPILYTNLKFYNKYLAGLYDDHPIWIARYNYREPKLACGRAWDFWQYGNKGRIPGVKGNVDLNVFKGTLEDLDEFRIKPQVVISQQ